MFGSSYLNHLHMSFWLGSWYEHPLQNICILQYSPLYVWFYLCSYSCNCLKMPKKSQINEYSDLCHLHVMDNMQFMYCSPCGGKLTIGPPRLPLMRTGPNSNHKLFFQITSLSWRVWHRHWVASYWKTVAMHEFRPRPTSPLRREIGIYRRLCNVMSRDFILESLQLEGKLVSIFVNAIDPKPTPWWSAVGQALP